MANGTEDFMFALSYLDGTDSEWSEWQVVRELIQNALDTNTDWEAYMEDGTLIVRDYGEGLTLRHLIVGVSEKPEGSRGQYGEGLSLALLVLTRLGYTAYIKSHNLEIQSEKTQKFGEDILRIIWNDETDFPIDGTEVRIPNWPHGAYEERFMLSSDPRIIYGYDNNYILDDPGIYSQNIYTCPASLMDDDCAFGYDLKDLKLNRDRSIPESSVLAAEIGKTWAVVQHKSLFVKLFQAVKEDKAERWMRWYEWQIKEKDAVKEAAQAVYGQDVVVQTNEAWTTEARYRGANPIMFNYGFGDPLKSILGTDEQYVKHQASEEQPIVPDRKLDPKQRKHIQKVRMLKDRMNCYDVTIVAALMRSGTAGNYNPSTKVLRIGVSVLSDRLETTKTFLHEMGHRKRKYAQDGTASMVEAVELAGAMIINSYTYRR